MGMLLLSGGCLLLLVVNALAFVTFVPLRHSAVVEYLSMMAVATLLAPAVVLLAMLSRERFRNPRSLLCGALAGLVASFALTAASVALSPPAPRLAEWNAAEKQAQLDRRCRERCRSSRAPREVCEAMCACTLEKLFAGHSDGELQRLTVEGPYGRLSRETNQLLGELGAQCAEEQRAARDALEEEPPS